MGTLKFALSDAVDLLAITRAAKFVQEKKKEPHLD